MSGLGLACALWMGALGGCAGEPSCMSVSWDPIRTVSDSQMQDIEEACNLSQASFGDYGNEFGEECYQILGEVIPLDSSFDGASAKEYKRLVIEGFQFLLFYPLAESSNGNFLGIEGPWCAEFGSGILDTMTPSEAQGMSPLSQENVYMNENLFRFVVERVDHIALDKGDNIHQAAGSAGNGVITIGTETPPAPWAIASTLVHEARHLPYGSLDQSAHMDCLSDPTLKDTCDDGINGAWGLEVMFNDALLRGSGNLTVINAQTGDQVFALNKNAVISAANSICNYLETMINTPPMEIEDFLNGGACDDLEGFLIDEYGVSVNGR